MQDYILEMQHITKEFPGVKALDDVTFKVRRGEIHALVGENGAGKSTLMKVLSGVYGHHTYSGEIIVNGQTQKFSNMRDSENAGIAIVYQELNTVKNLTIYENIFLGREILRHGIIDKNTQIRRAKELLDRVGLAESPTADIANIGVGKQQLVEIAKALNKNARILILDEPTSSLTEADADNLLKLLDRLRQDGVTCIYISHKLDEVFRIADSVTVLRDGQTIVTKNIQEMDQSSMVAYMVGRNMTEFYPWVKRTPGEVVMEVRNWTVKNPENQEKDLIKNVNLVARKGEILGIAGLMGAGRTELAMSLFGAFSGEHSGEFLIDGKTVNPTSPKQAMNAGLAYISEDRKRYGLVLEETIRENISLASLQKITKHSRVNSEREIQQALAYIKDINIRCSSMEQQAGSLSGGNQQKVVLAKWLLTDSKVLILDEPTRGIDVGAKYEIYQIINRLVDQGVCVIMISSELPEVLGMSDRIYVMREGEIVCEMTRGEATQEEIMSYAATQKRRDSREN